MSKLNLISAVFSALFVSIACGNRQKMTSTTSSTTASPGQHTTASSATLINEIDSLAPVLDLLKNQLSRAGIPRLAITSRAADVNRDNSIYLGFANKAPESLQPFVKRLGKMNPEAFAISADGRSVRILGNSVAGLRHAVYDYLQQIGFRYYQPGPEWQVVPRNPTLFIRYETVKGPAFHTRTLANGHGYLKNEALARKFNEWAEASGLGGFFQLNIGHIYQVVVANNRKTFLEHPEYFAGNVKKGEIPPAPKFNIANKDLLQLIKEDAIHRIKESARIGRPLMMVSMEPSDGGGYCNSPECLKIGNPSDQVFYLVNEVARHVRKTYPDMWVGSLAYNEHIVPTRFPLEKNVFVMVTNGFNRSKYSTYQLLEMWGRKAGKLGVYDYLNVFEWDNDMPGKSSASQLDYIRQSIPAFYRHGARAYMAETNVGYISKGLGQYVATRLLWDPSVNVDSLVNDYFDGCFGKVAPQIRKLYKAWDSAPKGVISDNLLADWIDWLTEADRLNKDQQVAARLDHIKMYLHYLAMYKRLKSDPSAARMNEVLVFANRTMDIAAFSTVPVMASLPKTSGFPNAGYYANPNQPWRKATAGVSRKELDQLLAADRKGLQKVVGLKNFAEARSFREGKIPLTSPAFNIKKPQVTFVGNTRFVLRISRQGETNKVDLTPGLSSKTNPGMPVTLKVYNYSLFQDIKTEADVLLQYDLDKMGVRASLSLASLKPGDYVVEVEDLQRAFLISFTGDLFFNAILSTDHIFQTSSVAGLNNLILDVPEGVTHFVVNKTKSLRIRSPLGRDFDFADNKNSTHVIEVKKGEAGTWLFYYQAGVINIEGVPPYLGFDPHRFLVPDPQSR